MAQFADAHLSHETAHRPAFGAGFSDLVARARRWREYRRTLAELEALDARTLKDIGLGKGDLPRVAREAAGY
ncbi:MAG: DUF1127 domain-containing protein [Pseudomonadota bacterium]